MADRNASFLKQLMKYETRARALADPLATFRPVLIFLFVSFCDFNYSYDLFHAPVELSGYGQPLRTIV